VSWPKENAEELLADLERKHGKEAAEVARRVIAGAGPRRRRYSLDPRLNWRAGEPGHGAAVRRRGRRRS
jgi:hypothetical protein